MNQTPIIHADDITRQTYIGIVEIDDAGETHIVKIETPHGAFFVAGGACNVGLLPDHARALDPEYESEDEALQEFIADLEEPTHPSGDLLAWHGSMVI